MLKRNLIVALLLSVTLISCYEGFQVAISNDSKVTRNIRVIYPAQIGQAKDSVQTYDHALIPKPITSRDYYRYPETIPVLSLDTTTRTYTFSLKTKHEAIIESGWPASKPTYGQMFIIDNSDTIELKRHGKDFKKRGSSWRYSIR